MNRPLINKFSRRTAEIGQHAADKGITNPLALDALGSKTRTGKNKIPLPDLRAYWRSRLTDEDIAQIENAGKTGSNSGGLSTAQALRFALDKGLERSSVMEQKRLLAEALGFGIGHVLPEDIAAEFERMQSDGRIISRERYGRTYLTTSEIIAEETAMLEAVRSTAGKSVPLKAAPHVFTPRRQ